MRAVALPVMAALAAIGMLVTGCSSQSPKRPQAVTASPTPIEQLNTGSMKLARVRFCSLVPDTAVRDALGGRSTKDSSWHDGDKADVEGPVDDVVREDGCSWSRTSSAGAVTASAWMFARAVPQAEAASIVADAGKRAGCRAAASTTFGSPGLRQACRLADGTRRVRVAGLIGDTWLSCEVATPTSMPATEVRTRTDAWCVQVANAVNTTR